MILGLVVTDDRYPEEVIALARAGFEKGWTVRCFLTSFGVRMLEYQAFADMTGDLGISACEHSLKQHSRAESAARELQDRIVIGGQYQNAELTRQSDRMLVL